MLELIFLLSVFSVSFLFEVSQQTVRSSPSSFQIKAVVFVVALAVALAMAAASGCGTASSFTCTSARRHVETLDSTAPTRPQLHVRRTHLDDGDNDDTDYFLAP